MTPAHVACLTPPGTAAIATLALRGPAAWTMVRELSQRDLPPEPQSGRFWLRRLGEGVAADEVVVAVKQITPETWLELHCHGGREVVRLLEDLFVQRGAVLVGWQQFESITTGDSLRATALAVMANAPTARTAAIALDQYLGALHRAFEAVRLAMQHGDTLATDRLLAELERWSALGWHLTTPWRVVIGGAPNVGKSSLVNALAGYQRSVASPIPGTTRDVVTTLLALDGWPVEVADTAGWRPTATGLEQEGITRARQALQSADVRLWLVDASTPPIWPDANLGPMHVVINKIDLEPAWPLSALPLPFGERGRGEGCAIRISAKAGNGLPELCQAITTWLVPDVPPSGAAVPFTAALAAGIAEVRQFTQTGKIAEALGKLENLCRECD